jgi:hypothetical protein
MSRGELCDWQPYPFEHPDKSREESEPRKAAD